MIERVTTLGSTNSMMKYITDGESKYYDLAQQASSGKKVFKPSDDPIGVKKILNINTKLDQMAGYTTNMKTAQGELDVLDDTFASLTDAIQNVNDLATQASNGTYTPDDLKNIKIQIDQILGSVLSMANTQYSGNYMFSGTASATEAYTTQADGSIVYNGTPSTDSYERLVNISDGVSVAINITGDQLFGSYTADPLSPDAPYAGTGTGIIGTLKELSNALQLNDTTNIQATMGKLETNLDTVLMNRTKFASVTNKFEMTQATISTLNLQLQSQRSDLEDADLTEVLTDLAAQQTALQASMSVTSQMLSGASLLDYL